MRSPWSRAFKSYLKEKNISRVKAAYELGRAVSSIHDWMMDNMDPSLSVQIQIEEWSKGAVRAQVPEWLRKSA